MTDHKSLTAALVAFQAELPTIAKGNTADVPTKSGGKYSYQYADLTDITAAVMPILARHGLSFTSRPTMTENGFVLAYALRHATGEGDTGEYPLPDPAHNPAQTIGSAITYARRYALCAATGVAPGGDDDDAGAAQSATSTKPVAKRVPPAIQKINAALTLDDLRAVWDGLTAGDRANADVKAATNQRKADLSVSVDEAWAQTPIAEVQP